MKETLIKLSVGEHYMLPYNSVGATANFLIKSGSVLQLALDNPQKFEIKEIQKGAVRVGLIVDQPVLLWLFDFGKGGKYDAPYDIRLYKKDNLLLPDITNKEQRLVIELHLIDSTTNTLKAIRLFTLPPELTLKFLSAAQDQLALNNSDCDKKLEKYYTYTVPQLIKNTQMYKGGE